VKNYRHWFQFLALFVTIASSRADEANFSYEVLPILSDACFHCHGPDPGTRKGGLRLDREAAVFSEINGHPVVRKGSPEESLLYQRITAKDPADRMPPSENHRQLSQEETDLLRRWIEEGAPWGKHWSFEPIHKPAIPETHNHPIDALVLIRLKKEGVSPSPAAKPETLLRRVALDLTGLPPTTTVAQKFLERSKSNLDEAYEWLVDDLLASPAYGERMAAEWMKVSRFSESDGYQLDQVRTQFPWRDWVIRAFNENLSYKQFIIEQTAGDLLENPTPDQIIATGFNRNHMLNGEGGVDPNETRIEVVADRVETTSTVFLGLTMACARCHDHKFDPITQKDYFSFFAYFNNISESGKAGHHAHPFLPVNVTAAQRKQAERYQANTKHHKITFPDDKTTIHVAILKEREGEPRKTHILHRGAWDQPKEEVEPAPPAFLPSPEGLAPDRLGLAKWMTADTNPLTARVAVNRYWELFFGRGLVKTQEDFGIQSARPSHPALLDWLAADFRDHGWNVKRLIKQIVMSSTYRQTSIRTEASHLRDPENALLSRASRFRHPSWMLRDQALAVSGLLNPEMHGPSVRPYQPKNIWFTPTAGKIRYEKDSGNQLYRKSLYTFWRRSTGPANMFDSSPRRICEVNIRRTNTPLHALVTLNDATFVEAARVLAQSQELKETDIRTVISDMFWKVLFRQPTGEELSELSELFHETLDQYRKKPDEAAALLNVGEATAKVPHPAATAALTNVALLLLNTDEALSHQ